VFVVSSASVVVLSEFPPMAAYAAPPPTKTSAAVVSITFFILHFSFVLGILLYYSPWMKFPCEKNEKFMRIWQHRGKENPYILFCDLSLNNHIFNQQSSRFLAYPTFWQAHSPRIDSRHPIYEYKVYLYPLCRLPIVPLGLKVLLPGPPGPSNRLHQATGFLFESDDLQLIMYLPSRRVPIAMGSQLIQNWFR